MSLGRKNIDDNIYEYGINKNVVSIGYRSILEFLNFNTKESMRRLVEESYKG